MVRQLFRAELIGSAFWHRYAMTLHSPSGQHPERFGVRRKGTMPNAFANNEIFFSDNRGYSLDMVGDALRLSLANYMAGEGLDKPVHKWFAAKVSPTTVEPTLVTDHLLRPDACRIFDPKARLVWIGSALERTDKGVLARSNSEDKRLKFSDADAEFLLATTAECSDLGRRITFGEIKERYEQTTGEPFAVLYHSKQWDILRGFGLLQL